MPGTVRLIAFVDEHRQEFGVEPVGKALSQEEVLIAPSTVTVVADLPFDGWDVAAVAVEPAVVEPVDVLQGREFDVVDASPWAAVADEFVLVEPVAVLAQHAAADLDSAKIGAPFWREEWGHGPRRRPSGPNGRCPLAATRSGSDRRRPAARSWARAAGHVIADRS
jgi:hypothetical protein